MRQDLNTWLSTFNREAVVSYENIDFSLGDEELGSIYYATNYWHSKTDPSSWLCEAVVRLIRKKFLEKLPREKAMELAACLLNITTEKLEGSLNWNAHYMAWHDGGTYEENHVWLP